MAGDPLTVEVRIYKRYDMDLMALCDAGYPVGTMIRDAVCAYAHSIPLRYYMDEIIPYDPTDKSSVHLRVTFSNSDYDVIYLIKHIRNRMRNCFLKMLLRNALVQENLTAYFTDAALYRQHQNDAGFRGVNLLPGVVMLSTLRDSERHAQFLGRQVTVQRQAPVMAMPTAPAVPAPPYPPTSIPPQATPASPVPTVSAPMTQTASASVTPGTPNIPVATGRSRTGRSRQRQAANTPAYQMLQTYQAPQDQAQQIQYTQQLHQPRTYQPLPLSPTAQDSSLVTRQEQNAGADPVTASGSVPLDSSVAGAYATEYANQYTEPQYDMQQPATSTLPAPTAPPVEPVQKQLDIQPKPETQDKQEKQETDELQGLQDVRDNESAANDNNSIPAGNELMMKMFEGL